LIAKCPACGRRGSLMMVSRIVNGKRYGPYPQVQHYVGYDVRVRNRRIRVCYIRTQLLKQNQARQLKRLLSKSQFSNVALCVVKGFVMERTTSEKPPINPVEGRSGSSSLMALKAAIEVDNHPQPPLKHPRRLPCEPSVFRAENVQNQERDITCWLSMVGLPGASIKGQADTGEGC